VQIRKSGLLTIGYTLSENIWRYGWASCQKLSSLVFIVALILDSGQVDGAKDFVRMESGSL
jgi:hypothetical protein